MEDIDPEKVKVHLAQRSANTRQASRFKDTERVLLGMSCAVATSCGMIVPTNAGLLFFRYTPQDHILQSDVTCVLFRETVFITNSIYRQLANIPDRTAHRDLETLVERGRLKGEGQRAARRYVLA